MKKSFSLAFCLIFFTALKSNAEDPKPILRLLSLAPMSGAWAAYGKFVNDGIQLAIDELNAEKEIKLEIVYQDACLPQQDVSALRSTLQFGPVDAIVGSYCVIGLNALIPELNQRKIIALHTSPIPQSLLDRGNYLFTTNVAIKDEAEKMAEYAVKALHAKTAAAFTIITPWGEDFSQSFQKRFKELGGQILISTDTPIEQNEFRSELSKLIKRQPDIIFAAHLSQTLAVFMREARELGIHSQILTVDEAEEQSLLDQAGVAAQGVKFFAPEPSGAAYEDFRSRFVKRFGHQPHTLTANAYDATRIAVNALLECRRDGECAKKKIEALKDYPGASGTFSIGTSGAAQKNFVLKTVNADGKFVPVQN